MKLQSLTKRMQDPSLKWVCLDCEANGKDPRTAQPLLLQVGRAPGASVVVLPLFTDEQVAELLATLATKLVVGHNLNYDYRLLKAHYPTTQFGKVYDTQLAEQILTTGHHDSKKTWLQSVSLKSLTSNYLGQSLDKEVRNTFIEFPTVGNDWKPTDEQVQYAAQDVLVLPAIVEKQEAKLKAEGLWRSAKLRFAAVTPLADVELRGMLLDQDAWHAYIEALETERREAEIELRTRLSLPEMQWRLEEYTKAVAVKAEWEQARDAEEEKLREVCPPDVPWGEFKVFGMRAWRGEHPNPGPVHLDNSPLNLQSHEQVKRAFRLMGLEVPSTDAKTRDRLLERFDLTDDQRSVLQVYTTYTKSAHNLGHFGQKILDMLDDEGRLYPHFNIHLTETGRMSSEDPNFQNFPNEPRVRNAFIASPGYLICTSDFSGQELAIAAALSGDDAMKEDIREGRDLYKELAVVIWGGTVEAVTDKQRKMAKAGLLGINYGQGPKGLYTTKGIPEEQGKSIIAAIRKKYSRLVAWGDEQAFLAERNGYVTTAAGTKRYFPTAAAARVIRSNAQKRRDNAQRRRNDALLTKDTQALNAAEVDLATAEADIAANKRSWKVSTEARNAPIQGTAADIVYRVIWRLSQLRAKDIWPLNYVHDEVVALVPATLAETGKERVEAEMIAAFYDLLPYEQYGVPARVDSHLAPYWTKA